MPDKKSTFLKDSHKISLADAANPFTTVTLYGKLIDVSAVPSSTSGLAHPNGSTNDLHASLVFGYLDAGRCVRLPAPQHVLLPPPDGPADGCGWDPNEFVVWKNIPKNWQTLHVQTQAKPLMHALAAGIAAPGGTDPIQIFQMWLGPSASLDDNSATLQSLWDAASPNIPFDPDGIARLVNLLQQNGFPSIQPDTVRSWKTLGDALNALG